MDEVPVEVDVLSRQAQDFRLPAADQKEGGD
jgi:hypothetical protein